MNSEIARFVRYSHGGRIAYGRLVDEEILELTGAPFDSPRETGAALPLSDCRLLAPCEPSKVIAVGLNYRSHLHGRPEPAEPGLFVKLPSAVIGPDDAIVIPPGAESVHYEGELVVVIAQTAKNVSTAAASDYVHGATVGNDVSERAWQRSDLQWVRAKATDTFAPLGPAIVAGLDYGDLRLETRLNGEARQTGRTRDLIFDVASIVSFTSRYITLRPGDLIFTGTPGSTDAMRPGDVVEVEIEGIGVLRNPVSGG